MRSSLRAGPHKLRTLNGVSYGASCCFAGLYHIFREDHAGSTALQLGEDHRSGDCSQEQDRDDKQSGGVPSNSASAVQIDPKTEFIERQSESQRVESSDT